MTEYKQFQHRINLSSTVVNLIFILTRQIVLNQSNCQSLDEINQVKLLQICRGDGYRLLIFLATPKFKRKQSKPLIPQDRFANCARNGYETRPEFCIWTRSEYELTHLLTSKEAKCCTKVLYCQRSDDAFDKMLRGYNCESPTLI